ncbi:MAG: anthranilate phosphoribosyltransferase [Deltaproteobacteria bacterium]|nr:anthranilate phosphoribosyltransferase [Deltaproteobacteria bacterium]
MDLVGAISRVIARRDLTSEEIAEVMGRIMDGEATPAQIGGFLVGLRMKGETPAEIAGAARAMRARATPIRCPEPERAVDTCGTGGDGAGTVNVSTLAAIVVAACGVRVAKHGNRALSSRAGSADVLEALGVNITASVPVLERCMAEANIAFLFAPSFHSATRHAAGPRKELGTRTLFNLLGPLTNPAGVGAQVVGVFDASFCEPVASALGLLGARRAFVVHGEGGLDEVAVRGKTLVSEWKDGEVKSYHVTPADFGMGEEDPAGLSGGDAAANALIARAVLGGQRGAPRTAVVLEAAVALLAAGAVSDFAEGAHKAQGALDSGTALATLEKWAKLSREA